MIVHTFNVEKYRICDEIKNLRNELNLTQKEFGKFFNIPQSNISMWENYKSAPPNYVISMMWKIIELSTKGEQLKII